MFRLNFSSVLDWLTAGGSVMISPVTLKPGARSIQSKCWNLTILYFVSSKFNRSYVAGDGLQIVIKSMNKGVRLFLQNIWNTSSQRSATIETGDKTPQIQYLPHNNTPPPCGYTLWSAAMDNCDKRIFAHLFDITPAISLHYTLALPRTSSVLAVATTTIAQ